MNDGKTQTRPISGSPIRRKFAQNMAKVFEQAAQIATHAAPRAAGCRQARDGGAGHARRAGGQDAGRGGPVLCISDPQKLMEAQMQSVGELRPTVADDLAQGAGRGRRRRSPRPSAATGASPTRTGRRTAIFDFLKQFYLISARWAGDMVKKAEGLDDHTRHKARFYVDQIANALSPSNFALTNPEVLQRHARHQWRQSHRGAEESRGGSATPDKGGLRIKQTDHLGLRGRQERGDDARQGDLPERYAAAHPICAGDREGLRDPAC